MQNDEQIQEIALSEIFLDRDTQVRLAVNEEMVQRYFDVMVDEAGRDKFPPVLLIRDSEGRLWLADGHHRVMAAKRRQFATIRAIILPGTRADAIWEAAKANARNGLPLFGSDYRRAVPMLAEAWPDRSNVMIAEVLGCSEGTVRYHLKQVRKVTNLATQGEKSTGKRVVGKDGKSYPAKRQAKKASPKGSVFHLRAIHAIECVIAIPCFSTYCQRFAL